MADDNQKTDASSNDLAKAEEAKEEAESAADKAADSANAAQKAEDKAKAESDSAKDAAAVAEKAEEKTVSAAQTAEETVKEAKEVAKEEKAQEPKAQVKVSKKLEGIISEIEKLSVLELSELVKALETKFGVTAATPMAVAAPGTTQLGTADEATSEQTTFNVILASSGANKISVIKAVREIVPTLGLKEAKDLVDAAPKPVLEGVNKENANEAKTKLETAGAKVELK